VIRKFTEARHHVPIAILPMGTANNVSRTLNLVDKPLEELIASWASARTIRFATGTVTGPWGSRVFIESVGAGFVASTIAKLDRQKSAGAAAWAGNDGLGHIHKVFRKQLQDFPASPFRIALDQKDLSGNYILVEVMNIKYVGPNLCLAPGADPTD